MTTVERSHLLYKRPRAPMIVLDCSCFIFHFYMLDSRNEDYALLGSRKWILHTSSCSKTTNGGENPGRFAMSMRDINKKISLLFFFLNNNPLHPTQVTILLACIIFLAWCPAINWLNVKQLMRFVSSMLTDEALVHLIHNRVLVRFTSGQGAIDIIGHF